MPTYCDPWPGKTKATGLPPYGSLMPLQVSGDRNLVLDVIPRFSYGAELLGVFIGDLHPVLLLEGHDELNQVEGVGLQVLGEGGFRRHLLNLDTELFGDDTAEFVEIRFGHPSLLLDWDTGPFGCPNSVYTISNSRNGYGPNTE